MMRSTFMNSEDVLRELNHALELSSEARECLYNALNAISSARNWGIWDLFGGGFLSGFFKHHHLDEVRYQIERANPLLRELEAYAAPSGLGVNIPEFAVLADLLLDGLIADLYMQHKIRVIREDLEAAIEQLDIIDAHLNKKVVDCSR